MTVKHVPQIAHAFSCPFVKALVDAGVIPDNCRRVVIDLNTEKAVKVYFEVYGDERLNDQRVLDAVIDLGIHIKTGEVEESKG